MRLSNTLLAAILSGLAFGVHAQTSICAMVPQADLIALSPAAAGKLFADEPVNATPKQVPKLPVAMRLEQCTGAMRASGAMPVRMGMLVAERDLSAAEWVKVERAFDDEGKPNPGESPQKIGMSNCWNLSWTAGKGKTTKLHEAGCSIAKGRRHMSLTFEHEDAAKLPSLANISKVLGKAAGSN